jgi:hypothetical protein
MVDNGAMMNGWSVKLDMVINYEMCVTGFSKYFTLLFLTIPSQVLHLFECDNSVDILCTYYRGIILSQKLHTDKNV